MTTVVTYYPGYSQVQVQDALIVQTIQSITQANPCVVTTVNNHNYQPGMMVRFLIPLSFGMPQLNIITSQIISITSNSFSLALDSTNFYPFGYPSPLPSAYSPPSVIPNSSGPYLPPTPLPYGNQDNFTGVTYNAGEV